MEQYRYRYLLQLGIMWEIFLEFNGILFAATMLS